MAGQDVVHLVCAQDPFLADELIGRVRATLMPDAETITLAPDGGDLPGVEEALFAPSLFSASRLVVVREAERLTSPGVTRLAEATLRGGLVATLVVSAVSERPPAALVKALQGTAKVHRLARPRRGELVSWVSRRLTAAGLAPGRDVPGLLVEAVGTDLRELSNAVEQLATRVGRGRGVDRAVVVTHFPGLAEQPVWALFDALVSADGPRAFRVLHALLAQGDDAVGILFSLVSQLRHVMRARSALERSPSLSDTQLAQALGVSPGRAAVLRRQASQLSWEWMLRMHALCARADFDLKGGDEVRVVGVLPPEIVLERLVDAALPARDVVPG